MNEIIIAIITGGFGLLVAICNTIINLANNGKLAKQSKENKMYSAKQAILQMVDSDYICAELLHKLPYNHSRILYEYDIYKANGGNSDIDEKIEEYLKWHGDIELGGKDD